MTKKVPKPSAQEILDGPWEKMVELLPKLSEKVLEELVELEMYGRNRPNWLLDRIYPRLSVVRKKRERKELKNKTWEPS